MKINSWKIDTPSAQDSTLKKPIIPLDTNAIKKSDSLIQDTSRFNFSSETAVRDKSKNTNALLPNAQNQVFSTPSSLQPLFSSVRSDSESLISNYQGHFWINHQQNTTCYFFEANKGKTKASIFVKDKKETLINNSNSLEIKEKNSNYQNWTFLPLLLGLFTLAFVITLYRKQLGQIFEKVVSFLVSNKHSKETSIHFKRFAIILDVLFVLSFSLLIDRAVLKLGYYSPPLQFEYLVFVITSAFLILLRVFRWFIFKLSGLFSGLNLFFKDLYSNSTLHTRVLSVFLLPSVFLITYTTGFISTYIIYISISITIIVLIIRIIRILRVFVDSGFSIFYFILYLCALEISPLLIIWKVVISR
jgi:hypothetical protein